MSIAKRTLDISIEAIRKEVEVPYDRLLNEIHREATEGKLSLFQQYFTEERYLEYLVIAKKHGVTRYVDERPPEYLFTETYLLPKLVALLKYDGFSVKFDVPYKLTVSWGPQ